MALLPRTVLLIKHSLSEIVAGVPAREWRLSPEGRRRCRPLADLLAPYQPDVLVSSVEPKAAETAALVARHLGLTWRTAPGLHEHDRSNVPLLPPAEFEAAVVECFRRPEEMVMGLETAAQARARFEQAVGRALAEYPDGNVAIVAHGTFISLFVAARTGQDPLPLWRRLGLPSFVALSLPGLKVLAVVGEVT